MTLVGAQRSYVVRVRVGVEYGHAAVFVETVSAAEGVTDSAGLQQVKREVNRRNCLTLQAVLEALLECLPQLQ